MEKEIISGSGQTSGRLMAQARLGRHDGSEQNRSGLDIIIPVGLSDEPDSGNIIESIIALHRRTGFYKFALSGPSKGWRSIGYPPQEHFLQLAETILRFQAALRGYGIICSWWHTLTLKSGPTPWRRIIKLDGQAAPFSSCPLDPEFRERFAADVALVAGTAKPAMIIFEDDFGLNCHGGQGCFCDLHLAEFANRTGTYYSREQLQKIVAERSPAAISLRRAWAGLGRDSLATFAAEVRAAVDVLSPEIPMGSMQPGCADADGDSTAAVAEAFAGRTHRPFVRLYGTSYGSDDASSLPENIFHALYSKQHLPDNFIIYHESDTYPHTRFEMSAGKMKSLMACAYSYGFDGSTFQVRQHLDDPNEEKGYYEMFCHEKRRFEAIRALATTCAVRGCTVRHDPFWAGVYPDARPGWSWPLAHFGIPYTTTDSGLTFLSGNQPRACSDEEIRKLLHRGMILDGEAARLLCLRGFSADLGVTVTEAVKEAGRLRDLCGQESIREEFVSSGQGRLMTWADTYSPYGNGLLYDVRPTAAGCETVTDVLNFQGSCLGPGMTRHENQYGGRVVVMAMTTHGNRSSSLFNYRRQRLLQRLVSWATEEDIVYVKNRAKTFCILNQPRDASAAPFRAMLTLINLCSDTFAGVELFLPEKWRHSCRFRYLDCGGDWKDADCRATADGVEIIHPMPLFEPLYLLCEQSGRRA